MPTNRKRRTRHRRSGSSLAEDYVHGLITRDELCRINPFLQFALTLEHTEHGAAAYEIWKQDGEVLLDRAGYQGKRCVPGTCIVESQGLPENLRVMLSAFGEPWKEHGS
ncbi:hypothetical protein ACFL1S_00975 [Pseudomonadota bacterium]